MQRSALCHAERKQRAAALHRIGPRFVLSQSALERLECAGVVAVGRGKHAARPACADARPATRACSKLLELRELHTSVPKLPGCNQRLDWVGGRF